MLNVSFLPSLNIAHSASLHALRFFTPTYQQLLPVASRATSRCHYSILLQTVIVPTVVAGTRATVVERYDDCYAAQSEALRCL